MPANTNPFDKPEKTYLRDCHKGEISMPTEQTYLEKLNNSHFNPYATALIRVAAEEYRSTGEATFTGTLDGDGQHLIFEVHYDPDFRVTGDDGSPETSAAREWVRLHVRDPQYNLSLVEVWVDLIFGKINIDDELASMETRIGPIEAMVVQLTNYLDDVLLPAIRARITTGKNPDVFQRANQSPT
jgi:hypothetical protein